MRPQSPLMASMQQVTYFFSLISKDKKLSLKIIESCRSVLIQVLVLKDFDLVASNRLCVLKKCFVCVCVCVCPSREFHPEGLGLFFLLVCTFFF